MGSRGWSGVAAALAVLTGMAEGAGCPADQYEICAISCYCLPVSPEVVKQGQVILRQQGSQVAAPVLADWITQSRAAMNEASLQPMPAAIRAQLLAYYPAEVLDSARFKIGDGQVLESAENILSNPDVNAVTLVDVIVFRDAQQAEDDVALWAHELWHVQQYREWGTAEFARRYVSDSDAVEAPAYAIQRRVDKELKSPPSL